MKILLVFCFASFLISATFAEEQRGCQSTKGEFGSLEGNSLRVPFAYQLELALGTAVEEVLETVETALVDQLLPYTFRECTEDDLITDVLSGVRSTLHPQPVNGVACKSVSSSNNLCFVVRGHLDVFLADHQATATFVCQAISMDLQAILDHHAMDHVTQDVVTVSFVDVNDLPEEHEPIENTDVFDFNILIYVAFTALVLVLAAFTLLCPCKTHSKDYLPLRDTCPVTHSQS